MRKPTIKITAHATEYPAILALALTVKKNMTGNTNFPNPSPSMTELQAGIDALTGAMTAWGVKGNRGSGGDLLRLRVEATNVRNMLFQEAAYVSNCVDPDATAPEQTAFVISSGFEVRNTGSPQGALQMPQNVRHLRRNNVEPHTPMIKWKKPLGLLNRHNVESYSLYRSLTPEFSDAVFLTSVTKTSFIDKTAPRGTIVYYFVRACNTSGEGVPSAGLRVSVPVAVSYSR